MPVVFTSIQATFKNDKPVVEFKVATEENIDKYIIERSVDNSAFLEAGSIPALTSFSTLKTYTWTDHSTLTAGKIRYRVKAIDKNGKVTYTAVVSLGRKSNHQVSISPNPITNGSFNISVPVNGYYVVQLKAMDGRTVFNKNLQLGYLNNNLVLPGLHAGTYVVSIKNEANSFQQLLLVR